ncbi:type VI secretion protein, EvpB/ family [Tritonibacter multivorans]|uniref:Type VI secretion protein, EvpB/ family n=1 Tax=Tritonibacter multivorans TaxID=928856 RepID=A0A0P1GVP4_9RHOB|nr:type VI secretion system contractile sheath large subunit [Tritonibacter multivorans]MDA7422931.1 type VI secretion system contractile sheath large subunit [Tritonibacter multivorans]CUH78122.1 type VI secretion protein, EvpB/ family [Tritonibacter multivorans]SFD75219.1 type VI secretion system protein ImpC [Tritonibacter multivorans]
MTEEAQVQEAGAAGVNELEDFSAILKSTINPTTEVAEKAIDNALSTVVQEAVKGQALIDDDVIDTIQSMIAGLDRQLSNQVNEILHNDEFQALESSWRGLAYTLNNSETGASLQVEVMNASKKELSGMMKRYPGAKWDRSPLYRQVYERKIGTLGGAPMGVIVGDYYFDHSSADVALLSSVSKIAEASLAPFLASAGPRLLGLDSWNDISNPPDVEDLFTASDYAGWNSLRDSENARFLGLTLPRVLAREPYGPDSTMTVEEFDFTEETDGHGGEKYAWMNAAHAMAVNINRAFKEHGWTVRIRGVQSGGEVTQLPTHLFDTGSGENDLKCPTEVSIDDRREGELSKVGLLGLIHRQNTDKAVFLGGQSLYKPKKYTDPLATASDNMSSRLPYMFAVSRFSHYLKAMIRDQIGSSADKDQIRQNLQIWIDQYVTLNPENADEREKASKPLAEAKVEVVEDELNPGYYTGKFFLKPHFQMEGMDIGMSLVSKIPPPK